MLDLAEATSLTGDDDRYTVALSTDWMGPGSPAGGYLAAIALRAVGRTTPLAFPSSFSCQFLSFLEFRDADVHLETVRETRRTATYNVSILQDGRQCVQAQIMAVADGLPGYEYDMPSMPDVPRVEDTPVYIPSLDGNGPPPSPMWEHLELRFAENELLDDGSRRARSRGWYQYRPITTYDDVFLDYARPLLLMDIMAFGAMATRQAPHFPYWAPNMDLHCHFHRDTRSAEWLMVEASSPTASRGLVGTHLHVWNQKGEILTSGISQLFCVENSEMENA